MQSVSFVRKKELGVVNTAITNIHDHSTIAFPIKIGKNNPVFDHLDPSLTVENVWDKISTWCEQAQPNHEHLYINELRYHLFFNKKKYPLDTLLGDIKLDNNLSAIEILPKIIHIAAKALTEKTGYRWLVKRNAGNEEVPTLFFESVCTEAESFSIKRKIWGFFPELESVAIEYSHACIRTSGWIKIPGEPRPQVKIQSLLKMGLEIVEPKSIRQVVVDYEVYDYFALIWMQASRLCEGLGHLPQELCYRIASFFEKNNDDVSETDDYSLKQDKMYASLIRHQHVLQLVAPRLA